MACCTASIERVRIVLIQVWSSCAFVTMASLCGGVFLARCRRWSSVIVSVVLSTGLSEVRWVNVLSAETPEPVAELEWGVEEAVGAADCSIEGEGQD